MYICGNMFNCGTFLYPGILIDIIVVHFCTSVFCSNTLKSSNLVHFCTSVVVHFCTSQIKLSYALPLITKPINTFSPGVLTVLHILNKAVLNK